MNLAAIAQQQRPKVSVELLAPDHYHNLVQAICNVLSTELAEITMAQLIDGLPLASSGWEARGSLLLREHPLASHETLCHGAVEQTKAFREAFDPAILRFDSHVMQAYQSSESGSREFNMRLVELVAVAIHQIAVLLFNLQPKLHDGDIDSVVSWKRESRWVTHEGGRRIFEESIWEPGPTLFFHVNYMDYDQYPNGVADIAGYWAEDQIFGGVILFDRGASGLECKDIYFHSGRKQTTFRVWRLLTPQFDGFLDFLASGAPPKSSPFPILASDDNLHRFDPWDAIAQNSIYRDPWERKFPPVKPEATRDVLSTGDYPELESMFTKLFDAYEPRTEQEESAANLWLSRDSMVSPGPFTVRDQLNLHSEGTTVDQNESFDEDAETYTQFNPSPPQSIDFQRHWDSESLYTKTPPRSPDLQPSCSKPGEDDACTASEKEEDSLSRSPNATDSTRAPGSG